MFNRFTPKQRGRVRITIEYDAVFVREMAVNAKDFIRWLATSPEREEIVTGIFDTLDVINKKNID